MVINDIKNSMGINYREKKSADTGDGLVRYSISVPVLILFFLQEQDLELHCFLTLKGTINRYF